MGLVQWDLTEFGMNYTSYRAAFWLISTLVPSAVSLTWCQLNSTVISSGQSDVDAGRTVQDKQRGSRSIESDQYGFWVI